MVENLFDHVRPWFEKAFTTYGANIDGLSWALALTTLPDPSRNDQFVSALTLYTQTPTHRQGQFLANTVMMSPGFDEAKVDETVRELMVNTHESLVAKRTAESETNTSPNLASLARGTP